MVPFQILGRWIFCALCVAGLSQVSKEPGGESVLPRPGLWTEKLHLSSLWNGRGVRPDAPRDLPGRNLSKTVIHRICRVTAYCDQGTTASGVSSGVGQCAAPADIPFGSTVYIPALDRTFVVTDRTARRFRRNTVDIFIPSERDCLDFGRNYLECQFTIPAPPDALSAAPRAPAPRRAPT